MRPPTRLLLVLPALAGMLLLTSPRAGSSVACAPGLAGELASTRSASQLVTVVARSRGVTYATVRLWQRDGACWVPFAGPWQGRLGANGISDHHREGDGTTPTGAYGIGPVIYGVAPDPGVHYRYHRLVCGDWWDEDPASPAYNTFRHVACGTRPRFGGASEPLWLSPLPYSHLAVLDYNRDPVVPGRGSGIFIHQQDGRSTAGCISLQPADLVRLLRWLRPDLDPLVVIGTRAEIRRF